jgi:hypothetical protein
MTGRALVSAVQRLLGAIVLAVSGGYMLVYLFRWEWNRAIISGIFFVSAEIALASSMILRRLRSLEQPPAGRPEAVTAAYETLRAADVERPNPFRWLTAATNGRTLPVLVPVLLGAGAVLSAIAYVVERIAEATALPAFDRQVAQRLATLAHPPAGLLSGPVDPVAVVGPNGARRRGGLIRLVVMLGALAVLAWLGGNALVEGAQSRPDPADRPASTTIDLAISWRGSGPPPTATADALWVACRSNLGSLPVEAEVQPRGAGGARLVLRPGIGNLGVRRLTGCLGDVRLDLVRAEVIRAVSVPS